jgi:DNA-binding NarL/FixJ family response regulator
MPRLNGLDAGEQVMMANNSVKLIFLTMTITAEVVAEAFRRGASGYVSKQSAGTELLHAVRRVNEGHSYLSPFVEKETVRYLLNQTKSPKDVKEIISRQREILERGSACRPPERRAKRMIVPLRTSYVPSISLIF